MNMQAFYDLEVAKDLLEKKDQQRDYPP